MLPTDGRTTGVALPVWPPHGQAPVLVILPEVTPRRRGGGGGVAAVSAPGDGRMVPSGGGLRGASVMYLGRDTRPDYSW